MRALLVVVAVAASAGCATEAQKQAERCEQFGEAAQHLAAMGHGAPGVAWATRRAIEQGKFPRLTEEELATLSMMITTDLVATPGMDFKSTYRDACLNHPE